MNRFVLAGRELIVLVAKIVCDFEQQRTNAFLEGYQLGQEVVYDKMAPYTHLEPQDGERYSSPLHHDR